MARRSRPGSVGRWALVVAVIALGARSAGAATRPFAGGATWSDPAGSTALAVSSDGTVIAESRGQIMKYSRTGAIEATFEDEPGHLPGQPYRGDEAGVATDMVGRIYVTYRDEDVVRVFSGSGQLLGTWGATVPLQAPQGIAVSRAGVVAVSDATGIERFDQAGRWLGRWTTTPRPSNLRGVTSMAFDTAGNLYLGQPSAHQVLMLNTRGRAITRFFHGLGYPYSVPGQVAPPPFLTGADAEGNVWAADQAGQDVVELGPNGDVKQTCTQLPNLFAFAVSASGTVAIAWDNGHSLSNLVSTITPTGGQSAFRCIAGPARIKGQVTQLAARPRTFVSRRRGHTRPGTVISWRSGGAWPTQISVIGRKPLPNLGLIHVGRYGRGLHHLAWSGKLGGHSLAPGSYKIEIELQGGGQAPLAASRTVRIVRR